MPDLSAAEQFSKIAQKYDSQRRLLIPRFAALYAAACASLDLPEHAKIADLGAGTGILSAEVAKKFPTAQIEIVDISAPMLDIARQRFAASQNITFTLSDFATWRPAEKLDAVVSALAIHHIPDSEKIALYKKIFENLKDGGTFVNAEQVLGETPAEIDANASARERLVQKYLAPEQRTVARERLKLDRCATVKTQLAWLAEIGFTSCRCIFAHLDFAVLAARKRS